MFGAKATRSGDVAACNHAQARFICTHRQHYIFLKMNFQKLVSGLRQFEKCMHKMCLIYITLNVFFNPIFSHVPSVFLIGHLLRSSGSSPEVIFRVHLVRSSPAFISCGHHPRSSPELISCRHLVRSFLLRMLRGCYVHRF